MERSSSKGTRGDSIVDFDSDSGKRYRDSRYGGGDAERGSRYGGADIDRGSRHGGGDADRGSRYGLGEADRGSRYNGVRASSRLGAESSASRYIAEDESVHNLWTTVDMAPHREKWRKKFRHSRFRVVGTSGCG